MVDGQGESVFGKRKQAAMLLDGKRNAFARRQGERTDDQRRGKPEKSQRKERRKRMQAEKKPRE